MEGYARVRRVKKVWGDDKMSLYFYHALIINTSQVPTGKIISKSGGNPSIKLHNLFLINVIINIIY